MLGRDLPGAVRVVDEGGITGSPVYSASPDPADSQTKVLRFSLAGVQLKFSAAAIPSAA